MVSKGQMAGRGARDAGHGARDAGRGARDARIELEDIVCEDRVSYESTSGEVRNFEDLVAWQVARVMARSVYETTRRPEFARDYGLQDQMRRAATSVMANIAEGHERGTSAEYHHYLTIAKGSCAELRSHLYVAIDANYIDQSLFAELMLLTKRVSQLVGALRAAIARRKGATPRPASRVPRPDSNSETTRPASRVPNPDQSATRPESRVPNPDQSATRPESRVPNPDQSATRPESRVPNPDQSATRPESRVPNPDQSTTRPASRVPRPDSEVPA